MVDDYEFEAKIIDCNQFYMTVMLKNQTRSFSLTRLSVSYDHQRSRLLVDEELSLS
jgi:hypothetical protein